MLDVDLECPESRNRQAEDSEIRDDVERRANNEDRAEVDAMNRDRRVPEERERSALDDKANNLHYAVSQDNGGNGP